ncbi:Oidioi.mRNA.OKI2018_I69.chr1.g3049.t1.cds [Oikopleura dioica]|uniref:S-adenosylmethionine decarboxylase proenzyme n=1 Tax=Oikopleura dioica TaxID=34765 RepID=A0ABN7ST01_OIKDI|nr:Oidioi.mRNA.OKI2018_I69.chr1.g3049.t1.cds [Oikopleura dioica]
MAAQDFIRVTASCLRANFISYRAWSKKFKWLVPDHFFEGAEKLLSIWFTTEEGKGEEHGDLKKIPRGKWDELVRGVDAEILSEIEDEDVRAFILSESSLFVFENRIIVKTCGTTRCLKALEYSITLAAKMCGLTRLQDVFYSRRNFLQPKAQVDMHSSFSDEVGYLDKFVEGGAPYVMGKVNIDCWFFYTKVQRSSTGVSIGQPDQRFELIMSDLDPQAMKQFYYSSNQTGHAATLSSGISKLIPGARIDSHMFQPCGYSCNAIIPGGFYFTIHITPETDFSFASFETNHPDGNHAGFMEKVLNIFKPGHLIVTKLANQLSKTNVMSDFRLENYDLQDLQITKYPCYDVHYSSYDVRSLADHC